MEQVCFFVCVLFVFCLCLTEVTCHVTGKTTLIRMLAGLEKPDDLNIFIPELHVSYKPQKISPKFQVQKQKEKEKEKQK